MRYVWQHRRRLAVTAPCVAQTVAFLDCVCAIVL
jgi:hypothetical protein